MEEILKELPEMLDAAMVAKILRVTPKTIRKHIEKNEIPAIKVGKIYRIPKEWFIKYIKQP